MSPMEKEHFEVILENVQTMFQVVVEGHQMLAESHERLASQVNARLDALERSHQPLGGLVARLVAGQTEVRSGLAALTSRIESMAEGVGHLVERVAERLGDVAAHVERIGGRLARVEDYLGIDGAGAGRPRRRAGKR